MLARNLLGAGPRQPPEFVGSTNFSYEFGGGGFDVSLASALSNIGAIAGDLIVIAMSADGSDSSWSWITSTGYIAPTTIYNGASGRPVAVLAYALWNGSATSLGTQDVWSNRWSKLAVVVSVFRGVSELSENQIASGSSGGIDPPSSAAGGKLVVVTGHIENRPAPNPPTGYELAGRATGGPTTARRGLCVAHRIDVEGPEDPGSMGDSSSNLWRATTLVFD